MVRAEGTIDWSLFKAGTDAGVPNAVMAELVRAFSWDVDFQRDIRKNDQFEVMFETKVDESGDVVHNGKIVGDKDVSQAKFLLKVSKQVQNLSLNGNIQSSY